MKRMMALVLSLVMALSLCVCPVWGADDATEQAAKEFIDTYLSNDEGKIFGHVKGYDGSLSKMFASEGAWNELGKDAQTRVNELLDVAHPGLNYGKLLEWVQGFMFMVEYLVIAEGDYEGYIISTDPNGGTLVDPDPPHNTFAIQPFTQEIWQRIVDAEKDFNALSTGAREYLEKLMTEEGFGLNNGIKPETLTVCSFSALLTAAKENLVAYEKIEDDLKEMNINPDGESQLTAEMVEAIDKGAKIWVDIQVSNNDAVSEEKQEQFKNAQESATGYEGYTINKYFEIEVLMKVEGFEDPVLASRTEKELWIPLGQARWGYDYAVLREHNGEIVLLTAGDKAVMVDGHGQVCVKSNQFSTFALLEKPKTTGGYVGGYTPVVGGADVTVTAPETFDAGVGVSVAVTILSMTGVAWLGKKKD